jgi:hypothetical protein
MFAGISMIACTYQSNLWIYRYWSDEHCYSTSAVSIRDGGIVQKSQENDNTGRFVDRTAQDHAADGPVSEAHPKLTDINQVSSVDTLEIVSNKDDNGDSFSIRLNELVDNLTEKDGEPPHIPSRMGNRPLEGGLRFPLCVLDPFIQKKVILLMSYLNACVNGLGMLQVVTQSINHRTLDVFQRNCKKSAGSLSQGASLDDIIFVKHPTKKQKKKASRETSKPQQCPEPDLAPTKVHAVLSKEMLQNYPGAVASGPYEGTSSIVACDGLFIDGEIDIPESEKEDDSPKPIEDPRVTVLPKLKGNGFFKNREIDIAELGNEDSLEPIEDPRPGLPEFEPEGFGLKAKYFEETPSAEDVDQPARDSVEVTRLESPNYNIATPHTDGQSPLEPPEVSGEEDAGPTSSGMQPPADHAPQNMNLIDGFDTRNRM